jgi:hypothetical protein
VCFSPITIICPSFNPPLPFYHPPLILDLQLDFIDSIWITFSVFCIIDTIFKGLLTAAGLWAFRPLPPFVLEGACGKPITPKPELLGREMINKYYKWDFLPLPFTLN